MTGTPDFDSRDAVRQGIRPRRTYTKGHIAIQHNNPATVIQVCKVEVKRLPATVDGT